MNNDNYFISCDWGTSSFRLRLIQAPDKVLATISNMVGIASIYKQWQLTNADRLLYYQQFLLEQINALHQLHHFNIHTPIIVSGMASASIGMVELPYKSLPISVSGANLHVHKIAAENFFPYPIYMVSGVSTDNDVMRGEEIQLIGAVDEAANNSGLYILPGTHSKHIQLSNNVIANFKTFITGELFNVLATESILANSIDVQATAFSNANKNWFIKGIAEAQNSNILHQLFMVRTNNLFTKNTKEENKFYLSGLLIGTELLHLTAFKNQQIVLVINNTLEPYYTMALNHLQVNNYQVKNIDACIVKGHFSIYQAHHLHQPIN